MNDYFNDDGTPVRMNPEAKEAWLAALESNQYSQGAGHLKRDDGSFCCLGLFAALQGCSFTPTQIENDDGDMVDGNDTEVLDPQGLGNVNESELLRDDYAERYGISPFMQSALSRLNDGTTISVYPSSTECELAFWRRLAASGIATMTENAASPHGTITIHPKRHNFTEIAAIIREYF